MDCLPCQAKSCIPTKYFEKCFARLACGFHRHGLCSASELHTRTSGLISGCFARVAVSFSLPTLVTDSRILGPAISSSLAGQTVVCSKSPNQQVRRLHLPRRHTAMEWTTPKHEEIDLNCEISSYANAEI